MTLEEMLESTPPGWAVLVRKAWDACQSHDPPLRVLEAKQKWGELRVYVSPQEWECRPAAWAAARRHLEEIREQSRRTCEECAQPARLTEISGWWSALCPEHEALRRCVWRSEPV